MNYSTPRIYLLRPDRLYHRLMSQPRRPESDLTAVINRVLPEYDLELLAPPQMLSGGNRSFSFLIHTSSGKKLFKQYRDSLNLSTIAHEHSILTYLAQLDFPAPRLVVTPAGQTLLRQGQRNYALFDFIEGGFQYHNYVLWPGQSRQFITIAGEMLAKLHNTLQDFVPEGYNPDGFKSQHEDRWRNLDWIKAKLTQAMAATTARTSRANNEQAAWLMSRARYLETTLLQLDAQLKEAVLPRLTIHADYGPYNLLFRKDKPAVILDFEMARLDWRIADLAQAWYRFGHDKRGFRITKMKWLLDAYQTRAPLTAAELKFVPAVWKFLNIWQCILNWHRYCENRDVSGLDKARWNLKVVDWIAANQDSLSSRLTPKNMHL